jgi:outer membrane protease
MKKILLLLLTLCPFLVFAEIERPQFALGWNTSLQQGLFNEIVYEYDETVGTYELSHLYWDMQNLVTGGPSMEAQWDHLGLWMDVRFPLYGGNGQISDYDWMGLTIDGSYDFTLLGVGVSEDEWTHFSLSDVKIKEYTEWNMGSSWTFFPQRDLNFFAGVNFQYLHIRWEDTPLYRIYSTASVDGFRDIEADFTQSNALNYEYLSISPQILLGLNLSIPWDTTINSSIRYSPLSWRETWDEHMLTGNAYNDIFYYTQILNISLSMKKIISSHYIFKVEGNYNRHFKAVGDTYFWDIDREDQWRNPSGGGAGSNAKYWQYTFSMGYLF